MESNSNDGANQNADHGASSSLFVAVADDDEEEGRCSSIHQKTRMIATVDARSSFSSNTGWRIIKSLQPKCHAIKRAAVSSSFFMLFLINMGWSLRNMMVFLSTVGSLLQLLHEHFQVLFTMACFVHLHSILLSRCWTPPQPTASRHPNPRHPHLPDSRHRCNRITPRGG